MNALAPSWRTQLSQLLLLKAHVAANSHTRRSLVGEVLVVVGSWLFAAYLGIIAFALVQQPGLSEAYDGAFPSFVVGCLAFVTTALWASWPVLSASVDDHSELARFAALPVTPRRLLWASTLISFSEPRLVSFAAPLTGAALGFVANAGPLPVLGSLVILGAYFIFNACLARVALYSVLNVVRSAKSAQLIGSGFLVFLAVTAFIPKVDASWILVTDTETGETKLSLAALAKAALAFSNIPTGAVGRGLRALCEDRWFDALGAVGLLAAMAAIAFHQAHKMLLRFHEGGARGAVPATTERTHDAFQYARTTFHMLMIREALDLWRNPRARMLATVPFVLTVLLRLLSADTLLSGFLGDRAVLTLCGALALYSAVLLASTFSQNAFGYDGHGFAALLTFPGSLAKSLQAKNVVHGGAALLLALCSLAFSAVNFSGLSPKDMVTALLAVATLIPVVLASGNFSSLIFPVKFHVNLSRRDRLPFAASMMGVAAASLGALPWVLSMGAAHNALAAAAAWGLYALLWPRAVRLLSARRETVFAAVTRE